MEDVLRLLRKFSVSFDNPPLLTPKGFMKCYFGVGTYGRPFHRGWIHKNTFGNFDMAKLDERYASYHASPVKLMLVQGTKALLDRNGSPVILPAEEDTFTLWVYAGCGYRGTSSFDLIGFEPVVVWEYYRSPRGNLGISRAGIYTLRGSFNVEGCVTRSGRLYGTPSVVKFIVIPEGFQWGEDIGPEL